MNKTSLFGLVTLLFLGFGCDQLLNEEQPNPTPISWEPLFNGQNFLGWNYIPEGKWLAEDSMIIGKMLKAEENHGMLITDQEFQHFSIRFNYKILKGNSGFYFSGKKSNSGEKLSGLEIELDAEKNNGSIYRGEESITANSKEDAFKAGDWNELYLYVNKDTIEVKLNEIVVGKTIYSTIEKGFIGLQLHKDMKSEVMFKDLEIQVLAD